MTRFSFLFTCCVACLLLSACAVGPDYERPEAPQAKGYTHDPMPNETDASDSESQGAQHFVQAMDIPGQWWTLFHSQALSDLIEKSLKANPDLEAAQAALRIAKENASAGQGAYFPTITGNFTPSRQKTANSLSATPSSGASVFNLYTASVDVSYTLDVFGGTRRQVEGLEASADQQRFQLEATYLTLTSNLVIAAFQEASLRGQIKATEEIIRSEKEQLGILHRQLELGDVAEADVAAQEALLAQAEQTLPPLQKQLAQGRDLLTALAGQLPDNEIEQTFNLDSLELPQDLPVSLPSKLVEQRPDVRAAEAQLHAASANVGVAMADMLPQITLSGSTGSTATVLSQLFTPGNGFWSLAAGVTQPLFEGGTLLHHKRAADAALDQASAQYRSTVITAFQNVADTLHAIQFDATGLKAATKAERAAAKSLDIAKKELALGEINYASLLAAEQTYRQSQIGLIQAQATRYADSATLFQALGGGWWNREDVAKN